MGRLFISFIVLFLIGEVKGQNTLIIDSLYNKLNTTKVDSQRVNLYNLLSFEFRGSELKKADSLSELAIRLGSKIEYQNGIGNAYINKAIVLRNKGEFSQSLTNARWALIHFVQSNNLKGYSSAYNLIAGVHFMQGNYNTALYYYFQSLKLSEVIDDEKGIAKTLNNIGAVYLEKGNYTKSLTYFRNAFVTMERLGDLSSMADCLNNIGNIYQNENKIDSALIYYQQSAGLNLKKGDQRNAAAALHNIGMVYFSQNNYASAVSSFMQALVIYEKLGDIPSIVLSYESIAEAYLKLDMKHASLNYAQDALMMAKSFNMKKEIMGTYHLLSNIEQANGRYKEALIYEKLYKLYSDSIYNIENTQQMTRLEEQYLKEKEEKKAIITNTENEINLFKIQEKEREVTKYIFIIGLVLILFVILIYIVFFLIRRTKYS